MASKPGGGGGERKPAGVAQGSYEKIEQAMKDSPYLKYDDLEGYKRQGYGTEGHLQVEPGTEPRVRLFLGLINVSSRADVSATETINRQGVR